MLLDRTAGSNVHWLLEIADPVPTGTGVGHTRPVLSTNRMAFVVLLYSMKHELAPARVALTMGYTYEMEEAETRRF
jgi:hypothetical protein